MDFEPYSKLELGFGNDTFEYRGQIDASSQALIRHAQSHPRLTPSLSSFPSLCRSDHMLFEYYLLRLCPLTTPSSQLSSPFANLIAPLFALGGQDLVVQSALAFSARHRSIHDPQWAGVAMKKKGSVLSGLLEKISSSSMTTDVISDPQVPATMMFMCLYEILDNCDHRWVIHLRASQDFMRKRQQLQLPFTQKSGYEDLTLFAERYFAFQDVISRTACGNSPLFGVEYWQRPNQSQDIDAWMGCSPSMASLIFKITELARSRNNGDVPKEEFEREAEELGRELNVLNSNTVVLDSLDDTLRRCAELKNVSVELYFHCLLRDAHPGSPHVSQLVADILPSVYDLVKKGCVAGLLFPLFVAAVELSPLDDDDIFGPIEGTSKLSGRRLVLEVLNAMEGSSLFNIERTTAVILKVWRMRDLRAEQGHQPEGSKNDWHAFVNPYTQNLSLA